MEMKGFMGGLYRLFEWIMRLAYVNLLWIIFTLAGFIVLGFIPATTSMFAVVRKWVMGESDIPIFESFWTFYKKEFIKSNLLFYFMLIIGCILYIDLRIFQSFEGWMSQMASFTIMILMLMYFLALLYLFPLFVHYKLKFFQYIKYAFVSSLSFPLQTVIIVSGLITLYFILMSLPGLLPFFSGSTISFVIMWAAYQGFSKKKEQRIKGNGKSSS